MKRLLSILLLPGCASFFGQTDGFPAKLSEGCKTEEACRQLETEARSRLARCEPNTIGAIRCKDAKADLAITRGLVAGYEREAEREEGRRRDAELEAERQRREDERRRREEERAEAERRRQAELEERVEAAWQAVQPSLRDCAAEGEQDACFDVRRYMGDRASEPHRDEAQAAYEQGLETLRARREAETVARARRGTAAPPAGERPLHEVPKPKHATCCDGSTDGACGCDGGDGCCFKKGGVCGCK
jgi:hypothetical protein